MRRAVRGLSLRVLFAVSFVLLGTVAVLPAAGRTSHAAADGCAESGSAPYLHTCGARIVAADGTPVVLHALNWYGFDSNDFVAGGLRYASYQALVDHIKALGYNALRIPFSNELVERNPVVSNLGSICVRMTCLPTTGSDVLGQNGDLFGLTALQILKIVVDYAGQQGLYVILDDHRSEAAWGPEENGLWYTSTTCPASSAPYTCFTPQSWLDDWATVARLFQNDPYVIGMDLRNEPHWVNPSVAGGAGRWQPTSCALYIQFAHWGPCGGINNGATDWAQAATQAGNELLALNPHWLMIVEGGSTYPQDAQDDTFSQDGWGENLQGVVSDPISLDVANRLVYSAHDYHNYQPIDSVASMEASWTRAFGFVAEPGQPYSAPLWLGEFGTCTHTNSCVSDSSTGNQEGWWFSTLMSYLDNPPDGIAGPISWGYWPVNGTYSDSWSYSGSTSSQDWQTCYGQREDYGVLGGDWSTLSSPFLQSLLLPPTATVQPPTDTPTTPPSSTATSTATPSATGTATATATSTVTATATVTGTTASSPTATATATASPDPTATTPAATATSSPTPAATSTPLPPSHWPTFACAPYVLTPTPAPTNTATATPNVQPQPRVANTATPVPTATATTTATSTPALTLTSVPTSTATATPRPKPRPHPRRKRTTPAPPPLLAAQGSGAHRAVWLDVRVSRGAQRRLSGWFRYGDRRKGLSLHQMALRAADIVCGATRTATLAARLGDRRHVYDATLLLAIDRHGHAHFTMRLGRSYAVISALTGSATITCRPQARAPRHPDGPPYTWERRRPPSRGL